MKSICVYCGSSPGSDPAFGEAAKQAGRTLAERGIRVVYGGGNVGLMGRLADGALQAGGEVIGVIPHHLADKELAHPGANQMIRVATMHERKQVMADLSDAFIALPGGIGTLEELFETLTWLQLGLHTKPVGLLNVHHFWGRMLDFLDEMVASRFLKLLHREMLIVSHDLPELLTRLQDFQAPDANKWLGTAHRDLR